MQPQIDHRHEAEKPDQHEELQGRFGHIKWGLRSEKVTVPAPRSSTRLVRTDRNIAPQRIASSSLPGLGIAYAGDEVLHLF